MALDDDAFLAALQAQFGRRMRFAKPGQRSRFPLALRLRDTLVKGREVWIGNTAQTLHPVSGQGFNLGLRDAWQLAETPAQADGPRAATAWPATPPAAASTARAAPSSPTRSSRPSPTTAPRSSWPAASACWRLTSVRPARHFVAKRMIWGARAWP